MAQLSEMIFNTLRGILPLQRSFIGLHEPVFQGNEWIYVKDCLDTGWVSSAGKYVDQFERKLAEYTGAAYAVAVVNGTAALHICLQLSGVSHGDEVFIPTFTFIATANAVAYCGATPHFVDMEEKTLGMNVAKLHAYLLEISEIRNGACYNKRTGKRIAAMLPMHTFGHPVDLQSLMEVCKTFHIPLIEDAAESLGSFYKGRHTGTFGALSAFSFNGNKVITTGGGGAIVTNDERLAKQAKYITTTAKQPHPYLFVHDQIGYNYRLPNLNAALGCAQLEQLPEFLARKRALAMKYQQAFSELPGVKFFQEPDNSKSNYWLNTLILDQGMKPERDQILKITNEHSIMTRPAWTLMHRLPMYEKCPKMDLSTAENLESRIINIPSSVFLEG